ncbi:hypothetical protein [Streptomyces sp. NPDC001787]|uniref:hypothetical protein n=1 Tax=Streptomyces sp. NPDC001787 TaxID=3154523 RepID=UPI003328F2F6
MGRALQRKKAVHLSPDELWAEAAVNEALETRGFGYDDQAEDGKADLSWTRSAKPGRNLPLRCLP